MSSMGLSREDIDTVQRLRQLYPPHILASLFDEGSTSLLSRKSGLAAAATRANH